MSDRSLTAEGLDRAVDRSPRHSLVNDPDDILHLVCCRDPEWRYGWCGADGGNLNTAAETLCTMCVEVAEERLPGFLHNDPMICPMDLHPCPDGHEVDLRILREISP